MAKSKQTLFLSPETCRLLVEYTSRHERFTSTSQSADHLLLHALKQDLGEALEALLTPSLRAAIRQELIEVLRQSVPTSPGSADLETGSGQCSAGHPTSIPRGDWAARRVWLPSPQEVAK